jgi:trimethylamine--corrinoid protein Co-methyltransferase
MQSEYHYPPLSDRRTPQQWEAAGAATILERARDTVARTLANHYPGHVGPALDARIRERFDIRLPAAQMGPSSPRWPVPGATAPGAAAAPAD